MNEIGCDAQGQPLGQSRVVLVIVVKVLLVEGLGRINDKDQIYNLVGRLDIVIGLFENSRAVAKRMTDVLGGRKVILQKPLQEGFHFII